MSVPKSFADLPLRAAVDEDGVPAVPVTAPKSWMSPE